MKLLQGEQISIEKWENLLNQSAFSSPFQMHEYLIFLKSRSGLLSEVFAVEKDNLLLSLCIVSVRKETGIIGFFSRRCVIYSGPVILPTQDGKESLSILLKGINSYLSGKVIYAEFYNFFNYDFYSEEFKQENWSLVPHYNIKIDIENKNLEFILSKMKYDRRRGMKASFNNGASIKIASNLDEVKQLYNILVDLYNDRVKLPLPSFNFFRGLYESPIGKVFLVIHEEKIIGGSFCFFRKEQAIYTYFHCGLREYHKGVFPAHLAVYAAIEYGINNKLKVVDLMGAGKPDKEYGVRESKLRFGGTLVEDGRFINVFNKFLYRVGTIGLKFLQKLKR